MLIVFEFAGVAFVLIASTTQIIWPLWKGQPLFPALRSPADVGRRLALAKEAQELAEMEAEIREINRRAAELHNQKGETRE